MAKHYLAGFLIIAGITYGSPAQTVEDVKLDDLIQEAVENNPKILAAQQRWIALQQREPQFSWDDPVFTYTRWISPVETRVGPQENVFALSQRIPLAGNLSARGGMATEEAAVEGAMYLTTQRDIVFGVKEAYFDLYRTDQSLEILGRYLSLLKDFSKVAEHQYATGEGIQANVLKSQVEISGVLEQQLTFQRKRRSLTARLNALTDRPVDSPIGRAVVSDVREPVPPESLLVQQAMKRRQELDASRAMIRRADHMSDLSGAEYWPALHLQATYITIPALPEIQHSDAGKDPFAISVGINLPLQLGRRVSSGQEAEATKRSAELTYRNLEKQIQAEIADYYFQFESLGKTLDLYNQGLILQAESSLESTLSAYRTGEVGFLDLLDAERALLRIRLGYVEELANYHKAVAVLERAAGGSFSEADENGAPENSHEYRK